MDYGVESDRNPARIHYQPVAEKTNPATLLIRCDDIGMCHAVNMACKQLIESGVVFSASVMFPCPWYQEAVDLLKEIRKSRSESI
jgi:hypothetical protein